MSVERTTRRLTIGLALAGAGSLLLGFVLAIFGDPAVPSRSAGNDSFSRSALGHHLALELFRAGGGRVIVGRWKSPELARRHDAPMLLIEPELEPTRLTALLEEADSAMLVLPKRRGTAFDDAGHVRAARLLSHDEVEALLVAAVPGAALARGATLSITVPGRSETITPQIDRLQTVSATGMEALLGPPGAILFGRTEFDDGRELFVLADPDLLATFGLVRGANAELALAALFEAAGSSGTLLVDETCHGHAVEPSIWRVLGRPPLVLALGHALALLAVLLWSATRRLGAVAPSAPALAPGRMTLVATGAELLLLAGRSGTVLLHYLRHAEQDVAGTHGAVADDEPRLRERLERIAARRRLGRSHAELVAAVRTASADPQASPIRLLHAARLVHRWRTEMLHGTR